VNRNEANDAFWFSYVSTWIYRDNCKSIIEAKERANNEWGCYIMGGEL
jgi:hypothetical protein